VPCAHVYQYFLHPAIFFCECFYEKNISTLAAMMC
jgi:hypothetical protein